MGKKPVDKHHIIPRSRCKELGIDPNFLGNVVRVSTGKHRAFHQIFGNKLPHEIIAIIEAEWSLSKEGQAEFNRLTNVRMFRRKTR